MSQKVVIERAQVRGTAPYLGMSAIPDGQQVPLYSTNPDIVMRWLCDGWRCRYNQLRSRRTKWDRESQTAVPLNGRPDMRSFPVAGRIRLLGFIVRDAHSYISFSLFL